jgi:hypothetical protein
MYKVNWKDKFGLERVSNFLTLDEAMKYNRELNRPDTTIEGGGYVIVGGMGVDSVKDGLCPDGIEYTWKKRRQ